MAIKIDFTGLREKADELAARYADRNVMLDKLEQIFLLDWQDNKPSQTWMKYTVSPDPRNALIGAMRLLIATDPKLSVPYDKSNDKQREQADLLEKAANIIYRTVGKVRQTPLHYDIVRSALLFGSVEMGIQLTSDLVQTKRAQQSKAAKNRFERLAKLTPFMVEVYDPRTCFQDYDAYGLSSFYRKREVLVSELDAIYGDAVLPFTAGKEASDELVLCEYWDDQIHGLWIDGENAPIILAEHNLPCMPIVSQTIEGSMLHGDIENRVQPFLFSLEKSGMWERQNLVLTSMYTNLFSVGSNPLFVYTTPDESSKGPDIEWSNPGGLVVLRSGETLEPLMRQVIDPALLEGLTVASDKITESTIYRQTLGEPLGSNAPYSMVALLNQSGRLPLVPYQRLCGNAISSVIEKGLLMAKESGGRGMKLSGEDVVIELKLSDIPENVMMDCQLDIALPQDDRQNVMVAQQVIQNGLASKRWARENYLDIGQSTEMEKEIYQEQMDAMMLQLQFQQEQQAAQQEMMAQQQGMQGMPQGMPPEMQGMPPQGMPPEMMGQGMPPEMMQGSPAQMAQNPQTASPGLPMTEPQEVV